MTNTPTAPENTPPASDANEVCVCGHTSMAHDEKGFCYHHSEGCKCNKFSQASTVPEKCPACRSPVKSVSHKMFLPKVRIDFECGYVWGNKDVDRTGFEWEEKSQCTRAFAAAVTLRDERDAIEYAAHMPADYQHGLASWINQHLYANYIGAKISDHITGMVEAGTLTFPNAPVYAQLAQARAERDAARDLCRDLQAERGVILNGYKMIAQYALPIFEKWHKKRPTHDTVELVSACMGAIEKRTYATNALAVEWMTEMREKVTSLTAELSTARAQLQAQAAVVEAAKDFNKLYRVLPSREFWYGERAKIARENLSNAVNEYTDALAALAGSETGE